MSNNYKDAGIVQECERKYNERTIPEGKACFPSTFPIAIAEIKAE